MTDNTPRIDGRPVDGGYRMRFLLKLSLIVALGTLMLFGTLFAVFSRPLAGDYGDTYAALQQLATFLFPIIAFSVLFYTLLVCGATAVLCVYALHKVAGPLYRMERVLDNYQSGEPIRPVFFRDGDQGAGMADAFNHFVMRLREERNDWLGRMDRAEKAFPAGSPAARGEMARALAEIASRTETFR